jgi:hypothetical protein
MAQMFKEAGGTVGGHVAGRVLGEIDEVRHYPDKYSKSEEDRLEALKVIHNTSFSHIPSGWTLDPESKTPQRVLMEGTWEKYWKTQLRDKKVTPLRGEVEDMLRVISNYLDERRTKIWRYVNVNGIKKGDVEEQFFVQMMSWLKDILDSSVDEMLEGKIKKYMDYLYAVAMSTEVFPSKFIHDKSASKSVVDKLHGMLGDTIEEVKKIQSEQFPLNKFQEISTVTTAMIHHFLRGFSHFSPILMKMDSLKVQDLKNAVKESDNRFLNLFLMFVKHFYKDDQDILHEVGEVKSESEVDEFYLKKFLDLMADDTKHIGLQKNMPKELIESISQIFQAAYNVSKAARLIEEATSVLSDKGAVELFCNKEGRSYFEFLLKYFKSTKDVFFLNISSFAEISKKHSLKEVGRTGEDASKNSELGQYKRFQDTFSDIQTDNATLDSHIENAIKQINNFSRKTPQETEERRDHLYSMIREKMREQNQHDLADMLEKISVERAANSKTDPPLPVGKMDDPKGDLPKTPNNGLLQSRQDGLRKQISKALEDMNNAYSQGFSSLFRSNVTNEFIDEFIEILENSDKLSLNLSYSVLKNFIESVEYANEQGKNKYVGEPFYVIACRLYISLSDQNNFYIIFPDNQAEAMKDDLSKLMAQKQSLEEEIALKNAMIENKDLEMQMKVANIEENRVIIDQLHVTLADKKSEISQLQLNVNAKEVEIDLLKKTRDGQSAEIAQLRDDIASQKKTLDDLLAREDNIDERIDRKVEEALMRIQAAKEAGRNHSM